MGLRWLILVHHRRYGTGQGSAFQICDAYSAMVRSLENFPEPAMFKIAFRAQPHGTFKLVFNSLHYAGAE